MEYEKTVWTASDLEESVYEEYCCERLQTIDQTAYKSSYLHIVYWNSKK